MEFYHMELCNRQPFAFLTDHNQRVLQLFQLFMATLMDIVLILMNER